MEQDEGTAVQGRRRRKEARPSELTAAALALFVEKGFAATKLDDIAARAGVSKGTLYLYFKSKEELFEAVVREGMQPALEEGGRMVAGFTGSSAELLQRFLLGWWALIASRPIGGLPKLVICEVGNLPDIARFYHDAVIARGQRLLQTVLQRGIASGEFRPMDAGEMKHVIFSPLLMLTLWRHSLGVCGPEPLDSERYVRDAIDLILRGVLADPSAADALRLPLPLPEYAP